MSSFISETDDISLQDSAAGVDSLLGRFYGRFPYPWPPRAFEFIEDHFIAIALLNQELGDWTHKWIPGSACIWVAGCGTNQAIYTALRFPEANVVGSDISASSLSLCGQTRGELGLRNLELRQESINSVGYAEDFDYVICTGVIHHHTKPQATLERLARSLRPSGVLELMVYNVFHRGPHCAFQQAVRLLGGRQVADWEEDLQLARLLVDNFPAQNQLADFLVEQRDRPESDFADMLIQPVEKTFTVGSLESMAEECGLKLLVPAISTYARFRSPTPFWDLKIEHPEIARLYAGLSDTKRWHLANLLLYDRSPFLWFYLQRKDSPISRVSEQRACDTFLETPFRSINTVQHVFLRNSSGHYRRSDRTVGYPVMPPETALRPLLEEIRPNEPIRCALERLGMPMDFFNVNRARLQLTTPAFPYMLAASTAVPSQRDVSVAHDRQ